MKKRFLSGLLAAVLTLTAAQGLVFAAPEDAETAADFDAHFAEMEAERERMEEERVAMEEEMERQRAEMEKHIIHKPERIKNAGDEGLLGIAAEKYSEIVYISNVDELRAIDGHDGGYYELTADIDLSGMEWEPLALINATFNGKGHTISGMTITKETDRDYIGFLCSEYWADNTNYVTDLNITDAVIDVELTGSKTVSIMGQAYSDGCAIEGSVNVSGGSAYGINGGENCTYEGNITGSFAYGLVNCTDCAIYGDVTGSGDYTCGIYSYCTGCAIYGDVTGSGEWQTYGIRENCTDCELYGDVTGSGDWTYGISDNCADCVLEGNVTGTESSCGLIGCTGCEMQGDVVGGNGIAVGIYYNCTGCTLYGNVTGGDYSNTYGIRENCTDCELYGDVTGRYYDTYGIYDNCADCVLEGNVTVVTDVNDVTGRYAYTYGISGNCTDCVLEGNVTGSGNWTYGIYVSTDCELYGDVSGKAIFTSGIYGSNDCELYGDVAGGNTSYGIMCCTDCAIYGDVTGSSIGYGINGYTGCYISGTITQKITCYPELTVTASQPYMAYYKCSYCGAEMTTRNYYSSQPIHCYSYYNNEPYANYYKMQSDLQYSYYTQLTPVAPDNPEPEIPSEPPEPELPDSAYTVQVIATESKAPISGAAVSIGGKKYTTDENGVIKVTDGKMGQQAVKIEKAGSVIYTNTSFMPLKNQMNVIRVCPIYIAPEDINIGKSGAAGISGPTINVLGKSSSLFEMPCSWDFSILDTVKMSYDPKEKSYKYILGTKSDIGEIQDGDLTPGFIKKYNDIQDMFSGKKNFEDFNNDNNYDGKNNKGQTSIEVFLELKLDEDKGMYMTNGGIIVGFSYGVEGSFIPFAAFPVLYVSYGIGGEAGAQLLFHLDDPKLIDPQFKSEGEVSFAIKPSVGVGLGARRIIASEAGIEGSIGCTFSFPFESMPKSFKAKLDARFYLLAHAGIFNYKNAWPFVDYQLYPRLGTASEDIFTIVGEEDFTPVSRDYLYDMSVMAESPDTIKANLYPYSDVHTVQLSDGRTLMVWLDDDTERADMDRTALYYSILDRGTWSEPQQIDNDGTADFQFALSSSGSGAAVVWQDMNGNMAEDASMSDMAVNTELSYAEFDGSTWGAPIAVTDGNTAFEYAPRLYYDGNSGYIAWTENDENSAMPSETAAERVYSVSVSGTNVSEPQCKIENIPLIYETEIGANGAVACIADKDGDKETKYGILYVNDLKCHESDMLMAGLRYSDGGFCFTDGGTLRKSSGSSTYASAVYDGAADGARLITNGSEKVVVYEVQDGFTSNLYASYYKNNAWTNPVRVTDYSEKMRSWDAELASDGTLNVFAVLADISVEDSDVKQSVRLAHTIAEPIESVEVRYIEAEPQRGKTVDFAIGVNNETVSDTLNISITGETAGELYSGTAKAENGVITVSVPIPEDFTKQNVTVTVSGESAEGSITELLGYADLEVMLTQNGKYARVTNTGCDIAENVTLTVEGEDGTELAKTTAEALEPGKSASVNVTLPEGYSGYVTASAATATDEAADYNNSASVLVSANSIGRLKINANTTVIEPGKSYMPVLNTDTFYGISDNEAVATVDDTGKISAVSEGTATITYTAPGASNAAKVRVYVHKLSAPEITSAEYSSDYVNLAVNTSSCLAEGETEQLIAAAYSGDGTLVGITMQDATAAEEVSVSLYTGEKEPKRVKVMLWNTAQQPASYAAEKLIE